MNLSKKMRIKLILAAVFAFTFLAVFLVISGTQSAYSTPNTYLSEVDGMDITIGPKPNSTDVPLDTAITIDALSSATLNGLNITPEVSISNIAVEVSGPLSYKQTFYPAQLLKPATSYTVSLTIRDIPISWRFTTTSEPYQPIISFYLATYSPWIALATAVTMTSLAGLAIWHKKESRPPDS
jgi:ABC-type oligopeptide transport system substrate-binding subunit